MKRLAVLVVLLAGCGGQLDLGAGGDEVRIGFVPKSLNQEYRVNTEKGAQAGARAGARRC